MESLKEAWGKYKVPILMLAVLLLAASAFVDISSVSPASMKYNEGFADSSLSRQFYGGSTGADAPQVRTGSATVKSENAASDLEEIRTETARLGGWVESESKYEADETISHSATLKISADGFDEFAAWLKTNYNVENSNFGYYRVDLNQQKEEIRVLLDSLVIYDEMLRKAQALSPSGETTEAIFQITQKKLEVTSLLKHYGYSLNQTQKDINYATLQLTITQDKPVDYIPDNLGKQFSLKIKSIVQQLVNIVLDATLGLVVIVALALQWIIYAFVLIIPAAYAYKILRKIVEGIIKKR